MNINRYNYEEFFLLYVDNELTKAERQQVETFVHDNPDLEEELIMLKQSKLRPDAAITFAGKEALMKPEDAGFINETNYEEFFLLYVDGELSAAERREIEAFAATKPQFQQELNLLLQTKIEPEHEVVFPDKSLLYRTEEKKRPVIFIGWQRVAAVAAVILVALGIFWLSNTGTKQPDTIAVVDQKQTKQQPQNNSANNNQQTTDATANHSQPQQPNNQVANVNDPADQTQIALQEKTKDKANKQANSNSQKYDEPVKNDIAYEPNKVNTVTEPAEQPGKTVAVVDVAQVERNTGSNVSTALETANMNTGVKAIGQPLQTVAYIEEDDKVYFANTTVDRSKLRGLFRKVTRVFEKTTNLPAVEEKGIPVGNLQIELK